MFQQLTAIGFVSKPEINEQRKYIKFTLKTYKSFIKNDQKIIQNTFFNCIVFTQNMGIAKYIKDGSLIFAKGEMQFNKVESDTGEAKYFSSFKIDEFKLLKEAEKRVLDEAMDESRPLSPQNQKMVEDFFGPDITPSDLPF